MTSEPTRIIAWMGEGEHFASLLQQAIELAKGADASLVLYDADAASRFAAPLPSNWSGTGAEYLFGDLLSPNDLERAGRGAMAEHVRAALTAGVKASGWLPGSRSADTLAEYAAKIGADMIILPDDLEDRSMYQRFRGDPSPSDVEEKTHRPTLVVATRDVVHGLESS